MTFDTQKPEYELIRSQAKEAIGQISDFLSRTCGEDLESHKETLTTVSSGLGAVNHDFEDAIGDLKSKQNALRMQINEVEDQIRALRKVQRRDKELRDGCEEGAKRLNAAYWRLWREKKSSNIA